MPSASYGYEAHQLSSCAQRPDSVGMRERGSVTLYGKQYNADLPAGNGS